MFGAIATESTSGTLAAQAKLRLGADTVVTLTQPAALTAELARHSTQVLRMDGVRVGPVMASLLEIDPNTFARGAYWDERIDGDNLADMAGLVQLAKGDQPAQAVASAHVPAGIQPLSATDDSTIPILVHSALLLPGEQGGYPMVLVPPGTLDRLGLIKRAHPQVWIKGSYAQTQREIVAAHLPSSSIVDSTTLFAHTWIEPATYTFRYVTGICLLGGLVGTVGLILYLEAGTPARRRAWVLLHRMGLRPRQHRWSLVTQTAIPVGFGVVVGLGSAWTMVTLTRSDMDVSPDEPPHTLLTLPVSTLIGILAALLLVIVTVTVVAHARTVRAQPAEVLRDVD